MNKLLIFKALTQVIPWYLNAFADGNVTRSEVKQLLNILIRLIDEVENET